jgi:hypothetical protein
LKKDYDGKKAKATKIFKKKKENFVQQELHQFDQLIKSFDEKTKWGWLLLYSLLKRHPLLAGPQCPWEHMKEEL